MKSFIRKIIAISFVLLSSINVTSGYSVHAYTDTLESMSVDTPLKIKALNPGYTIDGIQNVGEFIELVNVSDQSPLLLTGFTLRYTNSSGKISNIVEFPEGSQMTGETLLLRLSHTPDADSSDYQYSKTLAMEAGPLELLYLDEVVDSVCWKGQDCLAKFSKDSPTSIVQDFEAEEFTHVEDYSPEYNPDAPSYLAPPEPDESDELEPTDDPPMPQCRGLIFNEILSYYDADKTEQFIEFFNPTDEIIPLNGCNLRYKKKLYPLSGVVEPEEYYLRDTTDFTLTKNPNSSNLLELIDVTEEVIDSLEYPHGQKKGASYAFFGYENGRPQWFITYSPTPGAENYLQVFRSCPAGKVLNEATGNCVKASTLKTTSLECPAGKYRNPATGRCKKIEDDTPTPCKEGYERNPETGRCRKIKDNSAVNYALVPETGGERVNFAAYLAVGIVALVAFVYIIFQFRHEIIQFFVKIKHKLFPNRPQ